MSIMTGSGRAVRLTSLCFLVASAGLFFGGCSRSWRDPVEMIPADAAGWVAIRPVEEVSASLAPLVKRVPELAGAVELVRSVSGIDLAGTDPESGFDPRRGSVAALWRDGLLVILPVSDARAISRKIPLKLARFGFVEGEKSEGPREFESAKHGHACLVVKSGLAAIFVGAPDACASLTGLIEPPKDDGGAPAVNPVREVEHELGVGPSAVVFYVSNKVFAPELLKAAGLPTRGAVALVARGFIGDLRGAIGLNGGVKFRVAGGSAGQPFVVSTGGQPPPGPVSVDVTVGPSVRPLVDTALSLLGRKVKGVETLAASWSGALRFVADSSDTGRAATRLSGKHNPLAGILNRFDVRAAVGVRSPAPEVADLLMRRFGTPALPDQKPGVADFRIGDVNVHAAGTGAELLILASADTLETGVGDVRSPGLPQLTDGPRIASASIDPEGLLEATGFATIDYLRHLVDPISAVLVDIYYEGGRVVVDGSIKVR